MGAARVLILACFLVLGGIIYPFSADAIFIDDFLVSDTLREDLEEYPQIACDSAGNFVCMWVDWVGIPGPKPILGRLFIKGYDSQGNVRFGPKLVATDSNKVYSRPAIYMRPEGDFVVACSDWWNFGTDSTKTKVHVQRYSSYGNEVGNRISFLFADTSAGQALKSVVLSIGTDTSGRIVLAWLQLPGVPQVWSQIFDGDSPLGPPFKVSQSDSNITVCGGVHPTVAVFQSGKFVITFDDEGYVYGKIYDLDGTPLTGLFFLSCDTAPVDSDCVVFPAGCNPGVNADVEVVDETNFVTAWNACNKSGGARRVDARAFDSLGEAVTSNRKVNEGLPNTPWLTPEIDCDGKGNCIATWADIRNSVPGGSPDLFVQRLDSLGNSIGVNHRVNSVIGQVDNGVFDVATNGKQVYSIWLDFRDGSMWSGDIYAQVMDLEKVGVFTPGDGNLDGKVNVQDVIYLVNYVFKGGKIPVSERWISDVTGDCKVNLADVIYLVNYVFKGGTAPIQGCAY